MRDKIRSQNTVDLNQFKFGNSSSFFTSRHMAHDSPAPSFNSRELKTLQQQLLISLKFHHRQTLKDLPLELALEAMMEAWNSCNEQRPN